MVLGVKWGGKGRERELSWLPGPLPLPLDDPSKHKKLVIKSGNGAVVIKSSSPLSSELVIVVPIMNASCFGLHISDKKVRIKQKHQQF